MKLLNVLSYLIACYFLLIGCSDVVIWDPDEDELKAYSRIYIPQAENSVVRLTMDDEMTETYETRYNVFLGGPKEAREDIPVQFSVEKEMVNIYNEENGGTYKLLPSSVYQLSQESVIIPKGKRSSESISLKIIPDLELEEGTYLLPLSAHSEKANVNEDLNTVYIIVDVPAIIDYSENLVLSLGSDWGRLLRNGPRGSLYLHDNEKNIWVYKPNSKGVFKESPVRFPGDPWDISGWFYTINDDVVMVINDDDFQGMFRFEVEAETCFLSPTPTVNPDDPWPDNFGFFNGDGWGNINILPQGDFIFFENMDDGDLYRAPMDAFLDMHGGTWHKHGWVEDPNNIIATDFNQYQQVVSMEEGYLAAVKDDGTLWAIAVEADGGIGSAVEIGSGWDQFETLIGSGKSILALDHNGDLYRYEINLEEYYELEVL